MNLEGERAEGGARNGREARPLLIGVEREVKDLKERGEDEEKLLFGQLIADARSLADHEGHEVAGLFHLAVDDEPLGVELLGLVPQLGVVVNVMQVTPDPGVFGEKVAVNFDVSAKVKRSGSERLRAGSGNEGSDSPLGHVGGTQGHVG